MKQAEDIIVRPIQTEKAGILKNEGKYTFEVALNATKVEIKKATEEIFGVKVLKVNTLRYDGKKKRVGVHQGKTKAWKKAIVQIDTASNTSKYLTKGNKEVKVSKKYKTEIEDLSTAISNN